AIALSPTEVGSLIALGPAESCDFLHDPAMKSSFSLEGQVKKSLSISPMKDGSGYVLHFSKPSINCLFPLQLRNTIIFLCIWTAVVNNVQKTNERFVVPVTKAEFTAVRTVLS
ncbi:hypothetical protein GW17_00022102, partial [Ensete ventricosum]